MAVREFKDEAGVTWTAWNVTPESMHPQTRAEDYLEDCFQLGWLVFERADGQEKRRLCPYPARWDDCASKELCALLRHAEQVPILRQAAERASHVMTSRAITPPRGTASAATTVDVRTFRYPGGRYWTVCVLNHPGDGGASRLRFTSGARNIDMPGWPHDWHSRSEEQLALLLRAAAPRLGAGHTNPDGPRRRWDDAQPPR